MSNPGTIAVAFAAFTLAGALWGQTDAKQAARNAAMAEAYAKYLRTNPRPKLDPFKLTPGQVGVIETYGVDVSKFPQGRFENVKIPGSKGTILACTAAFGENQVLVAPMHYDLASAKIEPGQPIQPAKIGKSILIRGYPTTPQDAEGPRHVPQVLYVSDEWLPHKAQGNLHILYVIPAEISKEADAKYFAENPAAARTDPAGKAEAKPLTGVAKLVADLKSTNVETRRRACNELGKLGLAAAEAVAALKETAEKDGNEFVKKAAAAALLKVEKK
jgi:hypothetical protein